MQDFRKIFSSTLFPLRSQRAFTLIELLWSVAVGAILSTIGVAAFLDYSRSQTLVTATTDIASMLQVARSRAQSQVKPTVGACVSAPLDGYKVLICGLAGSVCSPGNADYELVAVCGGTNVFPAVSSKTLPAKPNISFNQSGTTIREVLFRVLSGGVDGSGTIKIEGYNNTCKVISIDSVSKITVNDISCS